MSVITNFFEKRLNPNSSLSSILGMNLSSSTGVNVSIEGSLTYSAVYAAVRVLSEATASLPLLTFERLPDGGKRRAENHYLYSLLKDAPNDEMTSFELREVMQTHLSLWGNAYAEIVYQNGVPVALWPIRPDKVTIVRDTNGVLWYGVDTSDEKLNYVGEFHWLSKDKVLHIKGLSSNGVIGYSPIKLHMETVGLGLATQAYGAKFFGNGARPGVILKHPKTLTDTAYDRLKNSWSNNYEGIENAHKMKILEEDMSIETIGVPPEEAQFLQTRKFQVTEIARIFKVPPHMIADLENATFTNIEHQDIAFVKHTLRPWLIRFEQSINQKLLTENGRKKFFVEHTIDALLRGDTETRYNAYNTALNSGWLSRNEVRKLENLNPIDGLDDFLMQLNMTEVSNRELPAEIETRENTLLEQREATTEDDIAKSRRTRQKLARDMIPMFSNVAQRVVRRESQDIKKAIDKYLGKRSSSTELQNWLKDYYNGFNEVWIEFFTPLLLSYAAQVTGFAADEIDTEDPGINEALEQFITEYLEAFGNEQAGTSRYEIEEIIQKNDGDEAISEAISERLDKWEESKADKVAFRQVFEASNAIAIATYGVLGITLLQWASSNSACDFCKRLDGKVIGINEYFITSGSSVDAGETGVMKVNRNIRSGNLHEGCDCTVQAVRN